MPTFAIISEGITDQIVLDAIVQGSCADKYSDDVSVNFLQPIRDATDTNTAAHGGWELVFEYCNLRMLDAVSTNDYVIIHVDTDCGDHERFGLALTEGGADRPTAELVEDAKTILRSKIDPAILAEHAHKLIFAIAVHSTECWLLLLLFDVRRTKGCAERLNRELNRKSGFRLSKDARSYMKASRLLKKRRLSEDFGEAESLTIFLQDLKNVAA
ncbi:hypothetical protein V6R86_08240 [Sphingomonas kaistensis]|uniref:Uncharacterized protein n=1 Tax=Sphingomonas kaistensis TaxID=298708 RepID=A0ABZ2G127_9SPHN